MMLAQFCQDEIDFSAAPANTKHWSNMLTTHDLGQRENNDASLNLSSYLFVEGCSLMLDDTVAGFETLVNERIVMVEWRGDFIYASAIDASQRDGVLQHLMRRGVHFERAARLIDDYNRFAASVDALHAEHMQSILAVVHSDLPDVERINQLRTINGQFRERF